MKNIHIIPTEEPKCLTKLEIAKNIAAISIGKEEPKQIKCYCGHTITCDCEPKQETLEEVAEKYAKQFDYAEDSSPLIDFIEGAKWQAERMYSERDMVKFGEWCENLQKDNKEIKRSNPTISREELFQLWREQFKKNRVN